MCWTAQSMDCPGGPGDSHLSKTNQRTGFHATLEGLVRTWRNDVVKRYGVSLPAHHPTVAWLVRHCAWLHDRFVMKRQDQQTPFQRQMARDYLGGTSCAQVQEEVVCRHLGRTRQFGRYAHHFDKTRSFDRQINPQACAERGSIPATFVGSQRTSRLKVMTDEPEVLPLPPAQSSTPITLPETAAAQDIAAEPAPATPAGGAEESKHCEQEQSEEKMKTDTKMDEVEEEREAPVPRKRW